MTDALAACRPTLHLSGPKLRAAWAALLRAAETVGGVERLAAALRLKSELFQDRLGDGRAATVERGAFDEIVPFLPTVRRRFSALASADGWPQVRAAMTALLHDAHVPGTADQRFAAFEGDLRRQLRGQGHGADPVLPSRHASDRFLRDLAAELLHNVFPEHYPLMTRWMWDARANTGVLREIWHDAAAASDEVDHIVIDVSDTHETFLALREELSQFLAGEGLFRDMLWYVDLLAAQVYGDYINAQGGAWLKTDFSVAAADPLEHTRRILGLDTRRASRRRAANSE